MRNPQTSAFMKMRLLAALVMAGAGIAFAQTPTVLDRPGVVPVLGDLTRIKQLTASVVMDYGALAKPDDPHTIALDAPAIELRVSGLPQGAMVAVGLTSEAPEAQFRAQQAAISTRCRGEVYHRESTLVTAQADGTAVIRGVTLVHRLPAGSSSANAEGPCTATLVIKAISPLALKDGPKVQVVNSAPYMLKPWVRYTYQDTWSLRRMFNFQMRADGASSCSGTSAGPSNFPVGVHERNGDLALQVRSGPAGTLCRAASPGVAVQKNLRLVSIEWDVQRSTPSGQAVKCCFADECYQRSHDGTIIERGHLPSEIVSTYESNTSEADIASRLGIRPTTVRDDQHLIGFAHAWMGCDATAVNDHGVRVVLKSAVFEGPAGAELP